MSSSKQEDPRQSLENVSALLTTTMFVTGFVVIAFVLVARSVFTKSRDHFTRRLSSVRRSTHTNNPTDETPQNHDTHYDELSSSESSSLPWEINKRNGVFSEDIEPSFSWTDSGRKFTVLDHHYFDHKETTTLERNQKLMAAQHVHTLSTSILLPDRSHPLLQPFGKFVHFYVVYFWTFCDLFNSVVFRYYFENLSGNERESLESSIWWGLFVVKLGLMLVSVVVNLYDDLCWKRMKESTQRGYCFCHTERSWLCCQSFILFSKAIFKIAICGGKLTQWVTFISIFVTLVSALKDLFVSGGSASQRDTFLGEHGESEFDPSHGVGLHTMSLIIGILISWDIMSITYLVKFGRLEVWVTLLGLTVVMCCLHCCVQWCIISRIRNVTHDFHTFPEEVQGSSEICDNEGACCGASWVLAFHLIILVAIVEQLQHQHIDLAVRYFNMVGMVFWCIFGIAVAFPWMFDCFCDSIQCCGTMAEYQRSKGNRKDSEYVLFEKV